MLEESIRRWNPHWAGTQSLEKLTGIKRNLTEEITNTLSLPHIKDIIGIRRSGKTTILYQIIRLNIEKRQNPGEIVFINFDDPEINAATFDDLMKSIEKINPEIKYLFLDEIQQKEDWERWLRTVYDTKRFKQIFISGSSASLLSQNVGRVLTGRHVTFAAYPFSFEEYLRYIGWTNFSKDFLENNKNKLLHYMAAYIEGGGFPETIGKSEFERKTVLTNIYNDILARDIASRFNASYEIGRKVGYYLLSNISKEYSFRSVALNTGLSVETVEKYIGFLEESFLILPLNVFSYKLKTQFKQNKKIYSVDTGLRNAVSFKFSEDTGRLAENLVLIEFKRRKKEIYYWKNEKSEIDFVVKEGLKPAELVQVCWHIENKKTKEREVKGLIEAMDTFKLNWGLIITEDYENEEKYGNRKIIYKPLWKWLLL